MGGREERYKKKMKEIGERIKRLKLQEKRIEERKVEKIRGKEERGEKERGGVEKRVQEIEEKIKKRRKKE